MIVTTKILTTLEVEINEEFPFYRSKETGEYGYPDYEATYWKIESIHKVTIVTTNMSTMSIQVYNDKNVNWIEELFDEDFLIAGIGYNKETHIVWGRIMDKFIKTISNTFEVKL